MSKKIYQCLKNYLIILIFNLKLTDEIFIIKKPKSLKIVLQNVSADTSLIFVFVLCSKIRNT
ncbi:hypothetical protein BpHYR1_002490 [Brachionus plicatilis]|uniref:Uncharacterized protein n=1 Tax=Brachionus plicatilis TaxID=10195 RepID=A0A3M7QQR8_BRAPC|nr:hypothetical protein BpHYR1_002490 [Brachionus plicatilis]